MAATARLRMPPLPLLAGAAVLAALLAVTLLPAGPWGAGEPGADAMPAPRVVLQKSLRFLDQPDGGVRVEDAVTGRTIETIEGESGFARGALRSMARERRRNGREDVNQPFLLQALDDGHLLLTDPSTGRRLDLGSFGPTNAGVFARLLTPTGDKP